MNILHISPHYGGGVGSVVIDLISSLQASYQAHNSVISIDTSKTNYSSLFKSLGINYYDGLFFTYTAYSYLIFSADIVIIHYWNHPLLAYFLATFDFPSCNIVFWSHTSGLFEPNIIPRFLFKPGVRVVFSSSVSFSIFSDINLPVPTNVSSIHSVRNLDDFALSFHQRTYTSGSRLIYIGTVSRQKMHHQASDIFKALAAHSFQIDIIGSIDDKELYEELNHISEITFHGHQLNILDHLLDSDIFIYPLNNRHYGTGEQVILEAMATGLPIVCFNNPAESVIINHLSNGILACSASEFVNNVLTISSDCALLSKLGTNAHNDVVSRFSINNVSRDFYSLFETMLLSNDSYQGGKIVDLHPFDLPYASMLANSFYTIKPYSLYAKHCIEDSLASAAIYYRSIFPNFSSLSNASKATPFQYKRYFPSSNLISTICAMLE